MPVVIKNSPKKHCDFLSIQRKKYCKSCFVFTKIITISTNEEIVLKLYLQLLVYPKFIFDIKCALSKNYYQAAAKYGKLVKNGLSFVFT